MNKYFYKCFNCSSQFTADEIESEGSFGKERIYLCPKCGQAEKNQPLKGVLLVEYDYENLKRSRSRDEFLKIPCGKFWRYSDLWPIRSFEKIIPQSKLERISLTHDPLLEFDYTGRKIFVFDDTRNPTLSYKDRATSLVVLKAIELGINEIAAASTGNAGSSLAGICARLGLKSHIFVPENIPSAKRIQIQSFGANLYLVKGDYDQAFDLCLEISRMKNWYNRNTAYNPMTIEGKKSAAFDIFISMKGIIPDKIFVPVGDGVIISGLYKGFTELLKLGWIEKLPQLIAVQAEGSNAVVRYVQTGKFEYQPASTIADSIHAGAPRNLYMAAHAVTTSLGTAISVSDEEILSAQKSIAQNFGIIAEPSSAASFAGYEKFVRSGSISANENVLLMLTGNGLKDTSALSKWNDEPVSKSTDEWKKLFLSE
ncbi:MAG: threonine synthase [Bacteroidetes bacterium]|nr:threonine synthase [Bacteroidota bacterium]MBU2585215.1 threonine synthase [Bacteroidota bacterium]